ncbi:MAG TPA: MarR family winged helix-turn-helix transcriptional regulator [Xanthomonadales bacterium]|nr:MarR family winged helix-turn-helix transcriptional regulator [Xanthomonadales bacterium]
MAIDPLENYPGYSLRRASAASMARLARRFSALELRPTEASVLMMIDANPNITQSEIGRMLDIASANMAPLVSRLADRGLLEREPVDGRSHGLTLTRLGAEITGNVKRAVDDHEEELLAKVPVGQRETFLAILRTMWGED